jgi:hypothetical protein
LLVSYFKKWYPKLSRNLEFYAKEAYSMAKDKDKGKDKKKKKDKKKGK